MILCGTCGHSLDAHRDDIDWCPGCDGPCRRVGGDDGEGCPVLRATLTLQAIQEAGT